MNEKHLDCKGLQCPGPIVKLFRTAKECQPGDILVMEATDKGFRSDVAAWCERTGNKLVSIEEEGGVVVARIEKV